MNCFEHFNQHRPLLFSIAYRMLGSVVDAEDMVQETFLRCQRVSEEMIQSPKTYLAAIVTRLCIDHLRSARVQRERYVGVWLPEPLISNSTSDPIDHAELAESLSFAFLTMLECLSPTERAIFLLHEVFDYDYADIAGIVGKSIPNCRQILRRARQHFLYKPDVSVQSQQKVELVEQFLTSWNQGDMESLVALMAEDVTFWADGGGKVVAARKPLHGSVKVARFLTAIRQSKFIPTFTSQVVQINGQPGIINFVDDRPQSIFSLEFVDGSVDSIFAVVNPDKLKSVLSQ